MAIGDKLVEFDVYAHQFYETLDEARQQQITRVVRVSNKSAYNERDLRGALDGIRMTEEPICPEMTSLGARFWTRAELGGLSRANKHLKSQHSPNLWGWHTGLGREAVELLRRMSSSDYRPTPLALGEETLSVHSLREVWVEEARSVVKRWDGE